MSDQDKTLKETLTEALSGNNDTAKAAGSETDKGISSKETEAETKSGDTAEYVSGIDISDIPEQDRPRLKELLSKKAKLLEDGYQGKFKEVAEFKKAQDELVRAGLTIAEARDALIKHLEQKKNPQTVTTVDKKDALKTLDKLIEATDDLSYEQRIGQRSALEQMRTIIKEETNISALQEKLDRLEKVLGVYQSSAMEQRQRQVEADLNVFSEKYGKDLVEKYREIIIDKALQHPNLSIKQIFQYEVPTEEIEQAILSRKKESGKKLLTEEKKNAISSPSSGITSATEKIDTKVSSFADILRAGIGK